MKRSLMYSMNPTSVRSFPKGIRDCSSVIKSFSPKKLQLHMALLELLSLMVQYINPCIYSHISLLNLHSALGPFKKKNKYPQVAIISHSD